MWRKVIKNHKAEILLFLLSLFILLPMWRSGLPVSHDGECHALRLSSFYQSLSEGILIPRWGGELNNSYGHPSLMFLFPLTMYLGSVFHFLGFSIVDSIKIVMGLSYVISGLGMFWAIKNIWGAKAGFLSGIFYLLIPYRIADLYTRGAIGENLAFMFLPLIGWSLIKLREKQTIGRMLLMSFSVTGLILSHQALTIIFLPLIVILAMTFRGVGAIWAVGGIIWGIALSAFYLLPAFFEGKYTLRDAVIGIPSIERFLDWEKVFSPASFLQINFMQWLIALIGLICLIRQIKQKLTPAVLLVLFFGSLFLMLPVSLMIWEKITIIQKFQFPWRFLALTTIASILLAGWIAKEKPQLFRLLLVGVLASGLFLWPLFPKEYWRYTDKDFGTLRLCNGTTDTGESSPRWSVRFMETKPKDHLEIISGQAKITEIKRTSVFHEYQIAVNESTQLVENTLYFPNWRVLIDGKETKVEYQDPNHRGLLTFWIPRGEHKIIEVKFERTKMRLISEIISVFAVAAALGAAATMVGYNSYKFYKNYKSYKKTK